MAVAAIQAHLEPITPHERGQAVTPPDAHALERNGLIEKLHAGLLAQCTTVTNRVFARIECIQPAPYGGGDDEQ